jgi:hypothetical protein
MRKRILIIAWLCAAALFWCAALLANSMPFHGCGRLVQGPNCVLFAQNDNSQTQFVLSNYGPFHAGDLVCVSGQMQMGCPTQCQQAIGCIANDSISTAGAQGTPYQGCGMLVQQGNCMLFNPDGIPPSHFRLDNYGGFHNGDRVCVSGNLLIGCQSACPGIDGCLQNNSISPAYPQGSRFGACGVIVTDTGCVIFWPGGNPNMRVLLDSIGSFQVGDTVRVIGTAAAGCQTSCPGMDICVNVDSIETCAAPPAPPIRGHAVMKLTSADSLNSVLLFTQSTLIDSIAWRATYLIGFPDSIPTEHFMNRLRSHPAVIYAEPSFEMTLPEVLQMSISFPDENASQLVVGVSPEQYYQQPATSAIEIDSAHGASVGSSMIVAVIDNGIDFSHPLFAGALAGNGYDFFANDIDVSEEPGSAFGHGTFVSGLIALTAPGCKILPLRAFGSDGIGSSFAIAQAIFYAVDHGAKVINMSFGVYENSDALVKACSAAVAAGVTLVAAAGSDSTFMPIYPAALPGVIAVSALDTTGAIAGASNYGDYIDVCAPGVRLYSSLAGVHNWGWWSGSSFAAALVSGTCALVRTLNPEMSSNGMEEYIRSTAKTAINGFTITPPDQYYGYGEVNAASAVWNVSSSGGVRGDVDGSGNIDISDAVYLCNYIFGGGAPPSSLAIGDVNCDQSIDISDAVSLIEYIFAGGKPPICP